jgi:integrase
MGCQITHFCAQHYPQIAHVCNLRENRVASISKHGKGWRASVARHGVRKTRVFPTKAAARDWAAHEEYLILNAAVIRSEIPLADVLQRYAREVSPGKRGERWEVIRLDKLCRDDLAKVRLCDLTAIDIAQWRDRRLRQVGPGSVRREMVLLSAVFTVARKEWGLISASPMDDVKKPASPEPRDRLATAAELERLALSAGTDLTNSTARAFHAFLFAVETGMRAGEIIGLVWERVDLDNRVARLAQTKNGTARDVPLSSEAVRLLQALPRSDPVFGLSSASLDALWRKLRDRAGVEGLVFHDSRHLGVTRLARKLDVLSLAKMIGHRNLSQLQVYFNESAADIAKRLD